MIEVCADEPSLNVPNTPNFITEVERLMQLGFSRVVDAKTNEIIDVNELKISTQTKASDYYILVDR